MKRFLGLFAVGCLVSGAAFADVSCPRVFQDHMVLQREMLVPIWGKADPSEKVSVSFGGKTVSGTADKDGKWMVKLPKMEANATGQEMTVTGKNAIKFSDVLVGEVWILGGQSNAESDMSWCCPEDAKTANIPNLRFMKVDHILVKTPQDDAAITWKVCTPENTMRFSACGFYFGRKLVKDLNVPVAILDDNWGGSNIRFWIPTEAWETVPQIKAERDQVVKDYQQKMPEYLDYLDKWAVNARKQIVAGDVHDQFNNPPERPEHGFMYNGMIAPVGGYAMRGMLWYQGEYNAGDPGDIYYHKMRALIGSWRKLWGQGDFPCYFVQLPNLDQPIDNPAGGNGWARMREVQRKSMQIPNTGMIVTIDVGEAADIHPKNKLDVGERLALWAEAKDYGKKGIVYESPFYKEMKIEGDKIRISFESVGSGLMVGKKDGRKLAVEDKGGKLKRFAIAGEDKKWFWADAVIDGETVFVSSPDVKNPVAVRYAFQMNPDGCNLYNKDGLPAGPFRTDDWQL